MADGILCATAVCLPVSKRYRLCCVTGGLAVGRSRRGGKGLADLLLQTGTPPRLCQCGGQRQSRRYVRRRCSFLSGTISALDDPSDSLFTLSRRPGGAPVCANLTRCVRKRMRPAPCACPTCRRRRRQTTGRGKGEEGRGLLRERDDEPCHHETSGLLP